MDFVDFLYAARPTRQEIPAKELEAWPAIGQKINWLPSERAPR